MNIERGTYEAVYYEGNEFIRFSSGAWLKHYGMSLEYCNDAETEKLEAVFQQTILERT